MESSCISPQIENYDPKNIKENRIMNVILWVLFCPNNSDDEENASIFDFKPFKIQWGKLASNF